MLKLLRIAGFAAYLGAIFLNAFVDLGHKIVIQNTLFKVYDGDTQIILTAIVNALILLPFVLLFTPSGYLADKFPKNRVMRASAWFAVAITLGITFSYYQGWFWVGFALTFLLAVQSAILSPSKYGYIRELIGTEQLAVANGIVQATTTIAILGGIFAFSIGFEDLLAGHAYSSSDELLPGIAPIGWFLVAGSLLEVWFTYRLPDCRVTAAGQRFPWPQYLRAQLLVRNFRQTFANGVIRQSIIGLSIFWAISQVVLAVFPSFAKTAMAVDNTVIIQGLLACSGIGIVLGSLIAGRVSRSHIEVGLIPLAAIGIALALFVMPTLVSPVSHALNFLILGTLGGIFIVPLNALIQFNAGEQRLGQVLATDNLVQNQVMLVFLGLTVLGALVHLPAVVLINGLGVIAGLGALYTLFKLPQSMVRILVAKLVSLRYRLNVSGLSQLPAEGGVLLLGNHTSWLDWAMVQMASPRPVRFVMERSLYERWYLKLFLDFFGVIPIASGNSKQALQTVHDALNAGEVVCLFPEGVITRSGQLAEFRNGFEKAAAGADAVIVPFYLHGLWGSRFSRSGTRMQAIRRHGVSREVRVAFAAPLPIGSSAAQVKQAVSELSVTTWQAHMSSLPGLAAAWLERAKADPGRIATTDFKGMQLSNRKLFGMVTSFSALIRKQSNEDNIGVLLPASNAGAITNLAVLALGRTVVNLNYTSPAEAVVAAIRRADIRTVYTSRKFMQKLTTKGIPVDSMLDGVRVVCLEDFRAQVSKAAVSWRMALFAVLPVALLNWLYIHPVGVDDTAAILFSSGSEGTPKGVELTHRNLVANLTQVSDVLDTREDDVVVATLPLFHAFGLTVTTLMPLLEGIPMVCHPDPTDALNISKAVATHKATILCGTSTFLRLYVRNRKVHPLMLDSLRIVVAGAEKLNADVRESFSLKFGKTIYEGYGTTETTPVASVNLPDRIDTNHWRIQYGSRPGTVGMPLPGSCFRIVDPETLAALPAGDDGLILIGGVQVMKGYLQDADKTAQAVVEQDGLRWYKTGDKGHVDADGFLTIVDRYSRFAKLGGEMISLSFVEEQVRRVVNDDALELVAVNLADDKKGEKVVLLMNLPVDDAEVRAQLLDAGVSPLTIPAVVYGGVEVPKLGSGKTDFKSARVLAEGL